MNGTLLPELTAFAARLRRAGFTVGPAEVGEALRAAELLGVLDFGPLEHAWGVIFAHTREQAAVFPVLLRAHFFPGAAQPAAPPRLDSPEVGEALPEAQAPAGLSDVVGGASQAAEPQDEPAEGSEAAQRLHTRLSPHAGQGGLPTLPGDDAVYQQAAGALLRGVRLGRSRRRRSGLLGQQVDLRATLQAARRSGGEPLGLRYRVRPPRPPRVVLLIDGSRSMAPYAAQLLRYAAALSARSRKVKVYAFSTSLTRLTPLLRAGQTITLGESWGGGTRIGENLARLRRVGRAHLRPDTLLLVLSDGLETGEPEALAEALRKVRARVGGVVWLNPLAAQAGYLPLARGMAAALPHLDVFAGVGGAGDLLSLPAKVRRALR